MTDAGLARLVDLDLLISSLRGEANLADRPGQCDRLHAAADVVVDALEYIQRLTAERDALATQLDALRAERDRAWDVAVEERLRRLEARAGIESPPEPEPDPLAGRLPLQVEYGLVWDDLGSADTFPTLEQARAAARGLDEPAQVVRIETWPVVDEGAER
jgi:hypothetical protein